MFKLSNPLTSPPLPQPAGALGPPKAPDVLAPPTPTSTPNPFRTGGTPSTVWQPASGAAHPTPTPPAPSGGNFLNSFQNSGLGQGLAQMHSYLNPTPQPSPTAMGAALGPAGVNTPQPQRSGISAEQLEDAAVAGRTQDTPPLVASGMVSGDSTLGQLAGGAQRLFRDRPETFAQIVGGVGAPLVRPLMETPFGLPAMAGLYGATVGGESASAARRLFNPLLSQIGLGS